MRSAHGAGFLFGLTQLGLTSPDIMIGTSGNSANMLYYIAGQYESAQHVWCTGALCTRKFISFWRPWRILNVDYLIDYVLKKNEPLDVPAVFKSSIEWFIPATDILTGTPRYFNKRDNLDIYEVLRAAKAIPIFYGKHHLLSGRAYMDGEFGPTIADHVHYAMQQGATRILLINDNSPTTKISAFIEHLYAKFKVPALRDAILRDIDTHSTCITVEDATIICVAPTAEAEIGILTNSRRKLMDAYTLGVQQALDMEAELRSLFASTTATAKS